MHLKLHRLLKGMYEPMEKSHPLDNHNHQSHSGADKESLLKRLKSVSAVAAGAALFLASCATNESEPGAAPDNSVSIESESPEEEVITEHPEASPSETPEDDFEEVDTYEFTATVDYADFEKWDDKDDKEKLQAVNKLLEQNGYVEPYEPSPNNTGPEVIDIMYGKFSTLWDIISDRSENRELNLDAAIKSLDALTYSRTDTKYSSKNILIESMGFGNYVDEPLPFTGVHAITRYTDETFMMAIGSEQGQYLGKSIEYREENEFDISGFGGDIVQEVFEWNELYGWRSVGRLPDMPGDDGVIVYYGREGNPPIVIDQARKDIPWQY